MIYNSIQFVDMSKIVLWRRQYLQNIKKYHEEGRHLYYLDETWVTLQARPG